MEMRKRIISAAVCVSLLASSCAWHSGENGPLPQGAEFEEMKEAPYQAKLDLVEPAAYRNADGLALEPGDYISVIGKASDGTFWEEVRAGAAQAAKDINAECGYKGDDKVKVTYSGPAQSEDVDEQVNILDEELARYPVAVAISIADAQACEVQFDLAAENDIPVVAFDSGSDYRGLIARVFTDNQGSAREAAKSMAEETGKKDRVVVLVHDSVSENAELREAAFVKTLKKKHPGAAIKVYHMDRIPGKIADRVNAGKYALDGEAPSYTSLPEEEQISADDLSREDVLTYILKKNPQVRGIFTTDVDTATDAVDALSAQGLDGVCVIGYDVSSRALEDLREGKIFKLAVQNPFGMGYASVVAAARAALGTGNEAEIDTGYVWVDRENLEDEDIQKILY